MQAAHLLVCYGFKPLVAQAFHLVAVVHNVAKAVEVTVLVQFLFRFSDGSGHAEAESRALVDFNSHHVM